MDRSPQWPPSWVGTWMAPDAKTVRLVCEDGRVTVTVSPGLDQPPYLSAPLLAGGTKRIERIPASVHIDDRGRRYLEIEAGTPELGPTYRLYAAVEDDSGLRSARDEDPADRLVLVPRTGIGLYDDFEDDLGVPWAYPLDQLRQADS